MLLNKSSNSTTIQLTFQDLDIFGYALSGVLVFLMTLAILFNGTLLCVLRQIDDAQLKVRFLVQTSLATDIILSINFGTRFVPQIIRVFGIDPLVATLCANAFYVVFGTFCSTCQMLASLAVACDRVLSVRSPLRYQTMEYTMKWKVVLSLTIWGLPLFLAISVILTEPFATDKTSIKPLCLAIYTGSIFSKQIVPAVLIIGILSVMGLYLWIVCLLFCRRRCVPQCNISNDCLRRRSVSVTITFFLVYLTYILLYLPLILYFAFAQTLESHLVPSYNMNIMLCMVCIYMLNTLMDPVIYVLRIRLLRKYVMRYVKCSNTTQHYNNVVYRTQEGVDPSVSFR